MGHYFPESIQPKDMPCGYQVPGFSFIGVVKFYVIEVLVA